MKKFNLFVLLSVCLIPVLICGMVFSGCNTDKVEPEVKTTGELYVIGNAAGAVKSGIVRAAEQTDFLVFTGDDIVSFDVWKGQIGGQIRFTEEKLDEIISRVELYSELHFLIDDKPVFDPPIRIYRGLGLSFSDADFDLQFRYDGFNVFLTDVYMTLDSISSGERESMMEELAANKQKRQQELDVFIAYLKDTGKLVNEIVFDIPEIEPLPEKSDTLCSYLFDKNVDKVKSFVDNLLSDLPEDMSVEQKINTLTSRLKAYPCIVDVEISEIETDPSMFNVAISFNEDGIIKDVSFVVSLKTLYYPIILGEQTITGKMIMNGNPCPPSDFPCVPGVILWLETSSDNYVLSSDMRWIWNEKVIIDGVEYLEGDEVVITGIVSKWIDMHSKEYYSLEIESIFPIQTN